MVRQRKPKLTALESSLTEYQIYGRDAEGWLVHAGTRRWADLTIERIRQDQAEWEVWAAGMVAQNPDAPIASGLHKTVKVQAYPVGRPELMKEFAL